MRRSALGSASPWGCILAQIDYLVVHHTATPTSWTVEQLRRLHVEQNGWRDIGYHYVIRLNEKGRAITEIGRVHDGDNSLDPWEYGAHVRGSNSRSLGIATVGDWTKDPIDPKIRRELVAELARLCVDLELEPMDSIRGHKEMPAAATSCPAIDMDALRRDVSKHYKTVSAVIQGLELWEKSNKFGQN